MGDVASGVHFDTISALYRDTVRSQGRFAFLCNHMQGHAPAPQPGGPMGILLFLDAHPFGTSPSPWANALPPGVPAYCSLQ